MTEAWYLWNRSNSCANEINSLLGYAISAKYIENSFDEKAKVQVF